MAAGREMVGQRFGRLVIIEDLGLTVRARCDCGVETVRRRRHVRGGHTRSCGCLGRDSRIARLVKLGLLPADTDGRTRLPEYQIWRSMLRRCYRPECRAYPHYGGRGIFVAERWRRSYQNFLADMGRRPSSRHTLDRLDNDGPYSPENCAWNTWKQQARNKRSTRRLTFRGETKALPDWADEVGIARSVILGRLKNGWSVEQALTRPVMRPKKADTKAR